MSNGVSSRRLLRHSRAEERRAPLPTIASRFPLLVVLTLAAACSKSAQSSSTAPHTDVGDSTGGVPTGGRGAVSLPLVQVADVPLPGRSVRFDYQDVDVAKGHLVIAHMND